MEQNQGLDLREHPLWLDLQQVVGAGPEDQHYGLQRIDVVLHTTERELSLPTGLRLNRIHVIRNYEDNVGDYVEIEVSILAGNFTYDIYPHLNNVEISIFREKTDTSESDDEKIEERYKAVFLKDKSPAVPLRVAGRRDDLNQIGYIDITFQLLDRSLEPFRIKTVHGTFDKRLVDGGDSGGYDIKPLVLSVIETHCRRILIDGKESIEAIHMEEPDNKDPLGTLIIPSGTLVKDLPGIIQYDRQGIYRGGVGLYIQPFRDKKTLFIYSLYDGSKFDKQKEKIIFIVPPTAGYSTTGRSYTYADNVLKIVTDPLNAILDLKESVLMNKGSGVRVSHTKPFMKKPVVLSEEGPRMPDTGLVSEFTLYEREDGLNYAPYESCPRNNNFALTSKLLKDAGHLIQLSWRTSDHTLLFPGAACSILTFGDNDKVIEFKGVIHLTSTRVTSNRSTKSIDGIRVPIYSESTVVTVFIDSSQGVESFTNNDNDVE